MPCPPSMGKSHHARVCRMEHGLHPRPGLKNPSRPATRETHPSAFPGRPASPLGAAPPALEPGYIPATGRQLVEVPTGSVYLHNRSGARKATGSYFTKPFAVEHLLDSALEPALNEHLARIKGYLDYGIFQPMQIAAIHALNEGDDIARRICELYRQRRNWLCAGLNRAGWPVEPPHATMFVWAPIPERFRALGSLEFSKVLLEKAKVSVSPGVGFGDYGDGHVRFALIENQNRIRQAVRGIRAMLSGASTSRRRRGPRAAPANESPPAATTV